MFLEVVDRIGEVPQTKNIPQLDTIINQLLSLSKYASDPKAHEEKIIDVLNAVVEKINK